MDSKPYILKRWIAAFVGAGLLLALPAQARITEPNAKKVREGYTTGGMEQWLSDPAAYAWNPINLRAGNHPDRPGGVTYIFPDASTANAWWDGVGTPPDEIPDHAVAYVHWALDNNSGSFPGIMARSDVVEFKSRNCIMASGAEIPPEVEGHAPLAKTCNNPQGTSKRFKMVVMKADTAIDMVFNIETSALTYENYSTLPTFNGKQESGRIYRVLQKWGNGTGTDTASSGPIPGTRIVGFNVQLGYGTGTAFTAAANGTEIDHSLGYELRPCMPDHFFDVLRDKPVAGKNPCAGLTDSSGQEIPQEIWLQQEFATFSPKMFSSNDDKRTTPVGGFWDKNPAGIINPETQSQSKIDSGSTINPLGYRGTTTPNYLQLPVTQGSTTDSAIVGNVFGHLMNYGVIKDNDRETLLQAIYIDEDGDPKTEGDLYAWWDGFHYRYGIDRNKDGVIDGDKFGIVPDSELAYMAERALDENQALEPPRFELGLADDLAGLNVDTFVYLGRNFDAAEHSSFTIRMVAQSATAAGADSDYANRLPEWYQNPAPPLSSYFSGEGVISIAVATELDDVALIVVDGNARSDVSAIMVTVKNLRSGESEIVKLAAAASDGSFRATLKTVKSARTDSNNNAVLHIIAGDVLEANYIRAGNVPGNADVLEQARGTVASSELELPDEPQVAELSSESSGRGGWCTYDPKGRFDPVLPVMLLVSLAFIGLRCREHETA